MGACQVVVKNGKQCHPDNADCRRLGKSLLNVKQYGKGQTARRQQTQTKQGRQCFEIGEPAKSKAAQDLSRRNNQAVSRGNE